jgi:hypothetical protein
MANSRAYQWEGMDIQSPLTIRSNQTIWTVEKLDKSIDRLAHPSQRWDMSFAVKTNSNDNNLFQAMTNGFANKGTMTMPTLHGSNVAGVNKPALGKITANGNLTGGSFSINASKASSATPVSVGLSAFVQFDNHNKVYAVTSQVDFTAGTGSRSFTIYPSLRAEVPSGTVIKFYDDVTYHYYIDDSNIRGITYLDGLLSGIDRLELLEAI